MFCTICSCLGASVAAGRAPSCDDRNLGSLPAAVVEPLVGLVIIVAAIIESISILLDRLLDDDDDDTTASGAAVDDRRAAQAAALPLPLPACRSYKAGISLPKFDKKLSASLAHALLSFLMVNSGFTSFGARRAHCCSCVARHSSSAFSWSPWPLSPGVPLDEIPCRSSLEMNSQIHKKT